MLAERHRVLRLLSDQALRPLFVGRLIGQAATWVFLLTVLVTAWHGTRDPIVVAWTLAAFLIPRLVVAGLPESTWFMPPGVLGLAPAIAAVVAVILAVLLSIPTAMRLDWVLIGAAAFGFLAAVSGERRAQALRGEVEITRLGVAALADAAADRVALVLGALIAFVVLYVASSVVAPALLIASAVALAAAALLAMPLTRRAPPSPSAATPVTVLLAEVDLAPWPIARRTAIYIVAAFTTGALGAVVLIVAMVVAADDALGSAALGPALIAVAGIGMLAGPLPVPRLVLRIPSSVLLFATAVLTALAAIAIVFTSSTAVALPAFLVFGVAAVTQDSLRALAIRRLVPRSTFDRVSRLSRLALTAGQVCGILGMIGTIPTDPLSVLLVLALAQILLVGVALMVGGFRNSLKVGGLSILPIKSVVHQLSWETEPEPVAAGPSTDNPRARRLAGWINRQVQLQRLRVTLPFSRREYEIYRPDDDSRQRLFDAGRADPDKQMPYWVKVWPSGVALADLVVERRIEVTGARVLEIGAGLGVTACAVLECGGHLVTADYSGLPLAFCRMNTIVNTGRAPVAACFNWRHESEVTAVSRQPEFRNGFPLIIAGDVLYEGRDAEPLLNVIDRLLSPDGTLWLGEPVRRTAQRFLNSAATLGWDIESRQVVTNWPDATSGPVNLHFLRRSIEPDRTIGDLGGWRI